MIINHVSICEWECYKMIYHLSGCLNIIQKICQIPSRFYNNLLLSAFLLAVISERIVSILKRLKAYYSVVNENFKEFTLT